MKPILIDTNAYSALTRGDAEATAFLEHASSVAISVIALGELLTGFKIGNRAQQNLQQLQRFLSSVPVEILPLEASTAERYAELNATLRKIGKPIPTNDAWIAATALEHGLALFSFDAHFRVVPSLHVVTRLADLQSD